MKKYLLLSLILLSGCLEPQKSSEGSVDLGSTAPLPINHPPASDAVTAKAVAEEPTIMGTRFYIRSVFEEIFQTDTTKASLQAILDKHLGGLDDKGISGTASFENLSIFGGTCDVYSAAGPGVGCNNSRSNIFNPVYSTPTPSREAVRVKLCTEITNNDSLINAALAKVSLSNTSPYTAGNFALVFDQFYLGTPASSDVQSSFQNLWNVMTTANETSLEKWRMIYFTVCRTPEWQIL